MNKYRNFKIAIVILVGIVIIQWIIILVLTIKPKLKKITKPPQQRVAAVARIAIVLDDWGYNLNNLPILEEIKYPLTLSILPNLAYSKTVAEQLEKRGFEIILHLPMEPNEKYQLEKSTILTSMDESGIKGILGQDLESIPYIKGVSNHMGSKLTSDARAMEIIFKELKNRNLYFLDSLVSSNSVASSLAKNNHILFAKRDIFLDNKAEYSYIKQQLNQLKIKARVYGKAIGIGHDRRITLEVLRDLMPEIEKEGYEFVCVSALVR